MVRGCGENYHVNIVWSGGARDKAAINQDSLVALLLCPPEEFGQFSDFDFPLRISRAEPDGEFFESTLVNSGREIAMFIEVGEHGRNYSAS